MNDKVVKSIGLKETFHSNGIYSYVESYGDVFNGDEDFRAKILTAQLFIEMQCDEILCKYHGENYMADPPLQKILSSEGINFSTKIKFLSLLTSKEGSGELLVPKDVCISLRAFAEVRNKVSHKLHTREIMKKMEGNKFALKGKSLNSYEDFDELMVGFEAEYFALHREFDKINRDIPSA